MSGQRVGDREGIKANKAKLTREDVEAMRYLYDFGVVTNQSELGRRFGISASSVHFIVNRLTYRNIP